jgi:hypothetical protein
MNLKKWSYRTASALLLGVWLISGCLIVSVEAAKGQTQSDSAAAQSDNVLTIRTDSNLPDTHLGANYLVRLDAQGGIPSLHWHLEKGTLPQGIKLSEDGVLSGVAVQGGEFQFTVSVRDSSGTQRPKRKDFVIHVLSAFTLAWKSVARVNGNRIDGSAEVSNHTPDDIDLTFVVMAVAGNGRATAIGYQHFVLNKGVTEMELPFGDTLPPGGYVVHVDAIGEVAAKKLIYRERMETPKPLHITVGP